MKHVFPIIAALLAFAAITGAAQDAEPSAAPETLDEAFTALRGYTLGESGAAQEFIIARINAAHGDTAARAEIAAGLAALLTEETTFDAKRFACQQLYVIGTEEQVPTLAPLLTDPELSHLARYALQVIPGAVAEKALAGTLAGASGDLKAGIINTMRRRGADAVALYDGALDDPHPAVRQAAAEALGALGTVEAVQRLGQRLYKGEEATQRVLTDAFLRAAAGLSGAGDNTRAGEMFQLIYRRDESKAVRMAALAGWAKADPAGALAEIRSLALSDDAEWAAQAMGYVRTLEADGATAVFVRLLDNPGLSGDNRALLIKALADRGDPLAQPAVIDAMESENESVRMAAMEGLAVFGGAPSAVRLATEAARASGAFRLTARRSLAALPGPDVDAAIIAALDMAESDVAVELLRALGDRGATGATGALLNAAGDADTEVSKAALEALAKVGTSASQGAVIALLPGINSEITRTAAERTLAVLALKSESESGRAAALHQALSNSADPATQGSLVRVLGEVGDPASLPVIERALNAENEEVRHAAVHALANWPGTEPRDTLLRIAETTDAPRIRSRALDGYLRMLREGARELPAAQAVARYEHAMQLAETASDKRKVLAGLAEIPDRAALAAIQPWLDDDQLRGEAAVAAERIRSNFYAVTASAAEEDAPLALDKDINTRWGSQRPMRGGEWFLIDMTEETTVTGLVLDNSRTSGDYPRALEVYVCSGPDAPGEPVASGDGTTPVTEIRFEPVRGRYVKIVQTGEGGDGYWWSIDELRIITH